MKKEPLKYRVENLSLIHIYKNIRGNFNIWLRGQAVKTSPFHGGNTGSIPVGVIECSLPIWCNSIKLNMPMWLNWQSS